jgi:carbamoyl-phosphate synthase small subunit
MSEDSINDMLKHHGVVGVCDVDTRSITRKIRNSGTLKCAITNEELSEEELYKLLNKTQLRNDWMKRVGTKEMIHINGNGPRIVLIDFGVKDNMVNSLMKKDCDITIMPYDTKYDEILQINPQGVLLSNGPGDPKEAFEAIELIKKVIQKYPTFGICMGHQILAHAIGGNTYKMKFGHRGGNHAVYDIESDRAYITSQNHGYSVDADSIKDKNMTITHINLNDNTVEGMSHKSLPVFSVQFHPEGSPGPEDSGYLFDKFINYMKGA